MLIEIEHEWVIYAFAPAITFIVSFFTSMGGLSGAFLLLPIQIALLGDAAPQVSATNQLYNVVGIPGGVVSYARQNKMFWLLAWLIVIGTMPGVVLGAVIRVKYLPDPVQFKFFAGFVLLYIAIRLLKGVLAKKQRAKADFNIKDVSIQEKKAASVVFVFEGIIYKINNISLMLISFVVGIAGGIYGIGGGAILAPYIVAFYNIPVALVAGASLFATFATSIIAVLVFQALALIYPAENIAPDWLLGLTFGIGGLAGMYFGARAQKYFPERIIKWILFVCLLFVSGRYLIQFFIED